LHPFGGVIFDIDGVLCDSEPFTAEAGCRMFAEVHRITVQPEDFRPFVGAGEDRYIGGVAEKYRLHIDLPRSKERMYAIYLEIIKGRLPPLPGAVEFVAWLRGRGMKLAVATSADTVKMEGNLREIGLPPEQFDACISGTEVRRKKPNPDIFLRAAERLGLPAAGCLVVEDAPNGVKAAKAAGSRCLALTTSFDEATLRDAGADWTAPDLAQVPRSILGG
jgi:HAD superfamily hydrolase (TIGR01509 family)